MMQLKDQFEQVYQVTEQIYVGFLNSYGDNNPLHTNAELARSKGFRDRVMHGAIQAGFLSHFIGEALPEKDVIVHTYELHFRNPVYLGDRLTLRAVIADYSESVRCFEIKFRFYNEAGTEVSRGKVSIGLI